LLAVAGWAVPRCVCCVGVRARPFQFVRVGGRSVLGARQALFGSHRVCAIPCWVPCRFAQAQLPSISVMHKRILFCNLARTLGCATRPLMIHARPQAIGFFFRSGPRIVRNFDFDSMRFPFARAHMSVVLPL